MLDHGHNSSFEAERVFTDRKEPIARFRKALGQPQSRDQYRVLVWYGVGGQGKSRLCKEMQQHLEERDSVAIASLDFENPEDQQPVRALLKLCGDLRKFGLQFPTFDLAYLRYFRLQNPGKDIRVVHSELFRRGENEIADDLLDWSEEGIKELGKELAKEAALFIPGFNLLYKYGSRLTGKLQEWWDSREVKDRLLDLDRYTAAELAERLPLYLGFDLWRAQAESDCPRIVLTVDTHEKLWGEGGAEGAGINLRVDQWLRDLIEKSPGILCLLFGRDRLRWSELDPDWNEALEQHLLGGLSGNDADWFLQQVPIDDPAIRARIIQSSNGLPFYLDLAVGQYETLLAKGLAPSRDAFGSNPEDVIQRFLQYLGADEKRDLVLTSYLDRVDEALFHTLAETFLGGAAMVNLAQLKRRSVLEENSQGHLSLHALMRQALQDQEKAERPELFERIHRLLFEHFDDMATVDDARDVEERHVAALRSTVPHAIALGAEVLGVWLGERVETYFTAGRYQDLQSVLERSLVACSKGSALHAICLSWLARAHLTLGRLDIAEAMYKESLGISEALDCKEEIAIAVGNLGNVYRVRGALDQAEAFYNQALDISKTLGVDAGIAADYGNLGNVYQARGELIQAEAVYLQSFEIYELLGDKGGMADNYGNLGCVYQTRGDLEQAERMFQKAIEINEELGHQSAMASQFGNLGNVYQTRGELDQAHEMYCRAIDINEAIGDNLGVATQLGNIGVLYRLCGEVNQAAQLFKQALDLSDAIGYSEGVAVQSGNLGLVSQACGDIDQAIALYHQALEISEACGHWHGMVTQLDNIGTAHQIRGELDEAEAIYQHSLAISEANGHKEGIANQYGNIGVLYRMRGELDKAKEMYLQALELEKELGRLAGMARHYGNLGNVYQSAGDADQAVTMYRQALTINESLGRKEGMAIQYGNLAAVCGTRGELEQAEVFLQQSIELYELLGHKEGLANQHANLGSFCRDRGQLDDAHLHWLLARDQLAELGSPNAQIVQNWIDELDGGSK